MDSTPWYHQSLSRAESEKLLKDKPNGSYLVRDSETSKDKVLSISWDSNVHHYKIKQNENGFYIDSQTAINRMIFQSCDELICYYKVQRLGFPYVLRSPILILSQSERTDSYDSDYSDEEDEKNCEDTIRRFFQQQLMVINKLRSDDAFYEMLSEYVNKGMNRDFTRFSSGSSKPTFLQQLLVKAGADLQCALNFYLKRLNLVHELFDVGSNVKKDNIGAFKDINEVPEDLESILNMMSECKNSILELEQKACKIFEEYSGPSTLVSGKTETEYLDLNIENKIAPRNKAQPSADLTQNSFGHIFEVTSGTLKYKTGIYLDVKACQIKFSKSVNDFNDKDSITYDVEKVLQLIKSNNSKTKLNIVIENSNIRTVYFENFKARENFCQTVLQMKQSHSNVAKLSIFIGTWNMGNAAAPANITDWFNSFGSGKVHQSALPPVAADVYAIGTQESPYHQKEWIKRILVELIHLYNKDFKLVRCVSLWGICIVIIVKSELMNLINKVKHSSVKTGIANTLGNKGAVGVSFNIGETSFCFVNCHLTSGNENVLRRNQNYHSILRGLNLGQKDSFDLSLSFHYLFWFGDLNYRIDLEIPTIVKSIITKNWKMLLSNDQLLAEIKKGNAFIEYSEEELTFPPTYKYTRGSRSLYCWTKYKRTGNRTNVPSWCDRILWKSYPELDIQNTSYGCTDEIYTSDHSPVFATFDVSMLSQNVRKFNSINKKDHVKMIFHTATAKVLTNSSTKFHLEFHSTCFEKPICSKKNSLLDCKKKQESLFRNDCCVGDQKTYAYPWWIKTDLPELIPVLSDAEYLQDQYILLAVKGEDSHESYGECVIALKPLLANENQEFECPLTHFGIETGVFKCKLQMKAPQSFSVKDNNTKSTDYAIISVGEDSDVPQIPLPGNGQFPDPKSGFQSSNGVYFSIADVDDFRSKHSSTDAPLLPPKQLSSYNQSTASELTMGNSNRVPFEDLKGKCDKPELYQWLFNFNCQCYYEILLENGYDVLDFMSRITEEELIQIKIENEAHRKQIIKHAKELSPPKL